MLDGAARFRNAPVRPDILSAADPIDWAARNGAKPGREGGEAWTIMPRPTGRGVMSKATGPRVTASLLRALEEQVGTLPVPVHATAHRWRYARSGKAGIGAYHRPDIALAGLRRLADRTARGKRLAVGPSGGGTR